MNYNPFNHLSVKGEEFSLCLLHKNLGQESVTVSSNESIRNPESYA